MATIKTDRIDYEKLLNGIDPIVSPDGTVNVPQGVAVSGDNGGNTGNSGVKGAVDNTSEAETMNQRLFEFDYDSERKGIRKKCRKSIMGIVKHVIPENMIEDEYIQDKIEQDIETLTELQMQVRLNTIMQRAHVEMTARGNYTARTSEVFGQFTDKVAALNKQIFETEARMRKTYVDLKYEIRDKQSEDFAIGSAQNSAPAIDDGIQQGGGFLVTSTKNLIEAAKEAKIKAYKDAQETKATVVE